MALAWEYHLWTGGRGETDIEELDLLGADGWEATGVAVAGEGQHTTVVILFKREVVVHGVVAEPPPVPPPI